MGDSLEARLQRLERRVLPSKRVTLVEALSGERQLDPVRDKALLEVLNRILTESDAEFEARSAAIIPRLSQDKASQAQDEPK